MFKTFRETIEWGGRTLTLETGKIARQADGAVVATYGETVVLATVVGAQAQRPDPSSQTAPIQAALLARTDFPTMMSLVERARNNGRSL